MSLFLLLEPLNIAAQYASGPSLLAALLEGLFEPLTRKK